MVIELRGENAVDLQKNDFELKQATRGINSCKMKISSQEKEMMRLLSLKEKRIVEYYR